MESEIFEIFPDSINKSPLNVFLENGSMILPDFNRIFLALIPLIII